MRTYYLDYTRNDYGENWRYKAEKSAQEAKVSSYTEVQCLRKKLFELTEMDEIVQWGFDDKKQDRNIVDTEFYKERKDWFKRHCHGYYAWKPYIIYDLLQNINENDIVVYWDCNPIYPNFTCSFKPFLNHIHENYEMLAGLQQFGLVNTKWTKPECFELMGCNDKKYTKYGCKQIQASWSIWKKTTKSMQVVSEWLNWCEQEDVVACDVNATAKHRHDQSVLTNVAIKHNCTVLASRRSGIRLASHLGKNLDRIAKNYEKCRYIKL